MTRSCWIIVRGTGGHLLLAGLGCAVVAGCRQSFEGEHYAAWVREDQASWRQEDGRTDHASDRLPTSQPGDAADALESLDADTSVDGYVRLALDRNPELAAAAYRVQRMAERVPQASSLDDPMLMVTPVGEMAQTAAGQVATMTGLSQKLPLPQKLAARGEIARGDVAVASSELDAMRLRVAADVRQSYWSFYYAERALEQTRQSRGLLDNFEQIAQSKLRTGSATQADVLRAMTELSNLDNELLTLARQRDTSIARLNSLIDRPVNAPLPPPSPERPEQIALRLDQLLIEAGRGNPQLRGVIAQIDQSRQRLRLARLGYWPDLTVSANYNFVDDSGTSRVANGDDQYSLGFAINLPIWQGRLRAAEREAFRGLQENISQLAASQNRLAFQIQDAYASVDTQQRLVALFHDVIVPQARQTVDASAAGYQSGSVDFLAYIQAWRKLLDYRLMEQRSIAQLQQQLAELERLLGRPLRSAPSQATRPAAAAAKEDQ